MADVKISALPAVTTPGAADLVPVVQSGVTSQMTMANLMGYGNEGQPPAPKPKNTASSEVGAFYYYSAADNTAVALPANGTWVILAAYYMKIADSVLYSGLNVSSNQSLTRSGGTTVLAGASGYYGVVYAWRIA